MATYTEGQSFHASASLAAHTSTSDTIDAATNTYNYLFLHFKLTWTTRVNACVRVELLASVDDGSTFATRGDVADGTEFEIRPAPDTLTTVKVVKVQSPQVSVKVTNAGDSAVTYEGLYTGVVV